MNIYTSCLQCIIRRCVEYELQDIIVLSSPLVSKKDADVEKVLAYLDSVAFLAAKGAGDSMM
jgi:hypothetical protein